MPARINCLIGQLAHLAQSCALRPGGQSDAAVAHTPGSSENFTENAGSHNIIQEAHRQVFLEWLTLSLDDQLRDFEQFMDAAEDSGDAGEILQAFSEPEARSTLVPAAALPVERLLFETELAEVVKWSFGAACATR